MSSNADDLKPTPPQEEQTGHQEPLTEEDRNAVAPAPALLPDIPKGDLNVSFLSSVIGERSPEEAKLQKRASNVLKLSEENEKLKAELRAMTERLEAAERRREQLAQKQQKIMEAPTS